MSIEKRFSPTHTLEWRTAMRLDSFDCVMPSIIRRFQNANTASYTRPCASVWRNRHDEGDLTDLTTERLRRGMAFAC